MDYHDRHETSADVHHGWPSLKPTPSLSYPFTMITGSGKSTKSGSSFTTLTAAATHSETMPIDSDTHEQRLTQAQKQDIKSRPFDPNDPEFYLPHGMSVFGKELREHASKEGWMNKHMPPATAFTKTRKRRYVVLVDRMIYTFKKDKPATDYREYFELTKNTNVFATDQFPGVLYCLEIQRDEDGRTWYLQADNVEEMMKWLDRFRKTISFLRQNREGVITRALLDRASQNGNTTPAQDQQQAGPDGIQRPFHAGSRNCDVRSMPNGRPAPAQSQEAHPHTHSAHPIHHLKPLAMDPFTQLENLCGPANHLDMSKPYHNCRQRSVSSHHRPPSPLARLPDHLPPQRPPPTTSLPPPPSVCD